MRSQLVMWILLSLFGDDWQLLQLPMDPEMVGFSLSQRPRICVVLLLRECVYLHYDVYGLYAEVINVLSLVRSHVEECLCAAQPEVSRESWEIMQVRNHTRLGAPVRCMKDLLTQRELDVVEAYEMQPRSEQEAVVHVGDNTCRQSWSGQSMRIPTYRHSGGYQWLLHRMRFMTIREQLTSMGWPVYNRFARAAGVATEDLLSDIPLQAYRELLGNSIHVANMGVVVLIVLLCWLRHADSYCCAANSPATFPYSHV